MPYAQLHIVVSEKDYLKIAYEVSRDDYIGVVQPLPTCSDRQIYQNELSNAFHSGCAGKIIDVMESDNDVILTIHGVCRFEIISEIPKSEFIAKASVSYNRYEIDKDESEDNVSVDTSKLIVALHSYLKAINVSPNWKEIKKTPGNVLISALAMMCPFEPSEKQSILETVSLKERCNIVTNLIEMNAYGSGYVCNLIN